MNDDYPDYIRRWLVEKGTISEKSLSDIRSLMATGVAEPSWPDPDEADEMAKSLADGDDPTKLRRLADWFDSRESDPEAETEVQDDLRRMARRFEEFVAPTAELEDALRLLHAEVILTATDEYGVSPEQEKAVEVLSAWLSER